MFKSVTLTKDQAMRICRMLDLVGQPETHIGYGLLLDTRVLLGELTHQEAVDLFKLSAFSD